MNPLHSTGQPTPINPFAPVGAADTSSKEKVSASQEIQREIQDWLQQTKDANPGKDCELHCSFPKTDSGAYSFSTVTLGEQDHLKMDIEWKIVIKDPATGKTEQTLTYPRNTTNPKPNRDYICHAMFTLSPRSSPDSIRKSMDRAFDHFRAERKKLLLAYDPDTYLPQFLPQEKMTEDVKKCVQNKAFTMQMQVASSDQGRTKKWHPTKASVYSLSLTGDPSVYTRPAGGTEKTAYATDFLGRKAIEREATHPAPSTLRRHKRYLARFICDVPFGYAAKQELNQDKKYDDLLHVDPKDLKARLEKEGISEESYAEHLEQTSHYYADYLDTIMDANRQEMGKLKILQRTKKQLERYQNHLLQKSSPDPKVLQINKTSLEEVNQQILHLQDKLQSSLVAMEDTTVLLDQLREQAAQIPKEKQIFKKPFSRRIEHYQESFLKALIGSLSRPWKTTYEKSITDRLKKRQKTLQKWENVFDRSLPSDYLSAQDIRWMTRQKRVQTRLEKRQMELAQKYGENALPKEASFPQEKTRIDLQTKKDELVTSIEQWTNKTQDGKKTIVEEYETWQKQVEKEKEAIESLEKTLTEKAQSLDADYADFYDRIDAAKKAIDENRQQEVVPQEKATWMEQAQEQLDGTLNTGTDADQAHTAIIRNLQAKWQTNPPSLQDYETLLQGFSMTPQKLRESYEKEYP